jgi:hypothetical protein
MNGLENNAAYQISGGFRKKRPDDTAIHPLTGTVAGSIRLGNVKIPFRPSGRVRNIAKPYHLLCS